MYYMLLFPACICGLISLASIFHKKFPHTSSLLWNEKHVPLSLLMAWLLSLWVSDLSIRVSYVRIHMDMHLSAVYRDPAFFLQFMIVSFVPIVMMRGLKVLVKYSLFHSYHNHCKFLSDYSTIFPLLLQLTGMHISAYCILLSQVDPISHLKRLCFLLGVGVAAVSLQGMGMLFGVPVFHTLGVYSGEVFGVITRATLIPLSRLLWKWAVKVSRISNYFVSKLYVGITYLMPFVWNTCIHLWDNVYVSLCSVLACAKHILDFVISDVLMTLWVAVQPLVKFTFHHIKIFFIFVWNILNSCIQVLISKFSMIWSTAIGAAATIIRSIRRMCKLAYVFMSSVLRWIWTFGLVPAGKVTYYCMTNIYEFLRLVYASVSLLWTSILRPLLCCCYDCIFRAFRLMYSGFKLFYHAVQLVWSGAYDCYVVLRRASHVFLVYLWVALDLIYYHTWESYGEPLVYILLEWLQLLCCKIDAKVKALFRLIKLGVALIWEQIRRKILGPVTIVVISTLEFIRRVSFGTIIFIFGLLFCYNACIALVHTDRPTPLVNLSGFVLGGYSHIVVSAMLLSPLIPHREIREAIQSLSFSCYRYIDLGVGSVGLAAVRTIVWAWGLALNSVMLMMGTLWKSFFDAIDRGLRWILAVVTRIMKMVKSWIIESAYWRASRAVKALWTSPYMSLVASIFLFCTAVSMHRSKEYIASIPYHIAYLHPSTTFHFTEYIGAFYTLGAYVNIKGDITHHGIVVLNFTHYLTSVSTPWVTTALSYSVFSLPQEYTFGWSFYLMHIAASFVSKAIDADPRFLARSTTKSLYFPLLFFNIFSFTLHSIGLPKLVVYMLGVTGIVSVGQVAISAFFFHLLLMAIVIGFEVWRRAYVPSLSAWRRLRARSRNRDGRRRPSSTPRARGSKSKLLTTSNPIVKYHCPECVICLDDFNESIDQSPHEASDSAAVYLPCGHRFHSCCVNEWLREHNLCPTCRESVEIENTVTASLRHTFM